MVEYKKLYERPYLFEYVKINPKLKYGSCFCYLFYKNTHNLMKYLSSPKLNKKYIAKYYNFIPWSEHAV